MPHPLETLADQFRQRAQVMFGIDLKEQEEQKEFAKMGAVASYITGTVLPALAGKEANPRMIMGQLVQEGVRRGIDPARTMGLFNAVYQTGVQLNQQAQGVDYAERLKQAKAARDIASMTTEELPEEERGFTWEERLQLRREAATEVQREAEFRARQAEYAVAEKERGEARYARTFAGISEAARLREGVPLLNVIANHMSERIGTITAMPDTTKLREIVESLEENYDIDVPEEWLTWPWRITRNKPQTLDQIAEMITAKEWNEDLSRYYTRDAVKGFILKKLKGEIVAPERIINAAPIVTGTALSLGQ